MGDSGEKFVLRWGEFEKNIVGAYKELRLDKNLQDISLVCQGGTCSAHRVILSACSPVFQDIIREVTHHHPVVYMRGVKSDHMVALLDFMYHGQASVAESELERFLAVAEDLEVRGLTGGDKTATETGASPRSGQVSDVDLDTAVDDDVNSLLAGLDDQPPPKRVKQERREAEQTTPTGDRTRVKEEQRSSKRASLPASLGSNSLQGVTLTRPTSTIPTTPSSLDRMRNLISISASPHTAPSTQSQPPPAYPSPPVRLNIASPNPLVRPGLPHLNQSQPVRPHLNQSQPVRPHLNQSQPVSGVHYQMYPHQQDLRLAQVEQSKDGSPPVLHLPDNMAGVPGGGEGTFQVPDGRGELEHQRLIEAYIERGEGNSKLSCKSCGKTVTTKNKSALVAHIESVHLMVDLECKSCNKKFKATSYLKQHQKRSGCTGS